VALVVPSFLDPAETIRKTGRAAGTAGTSLAPTREIEGRFVAIWKVAMRAICQLRPSQCTSEQEGQKDDVS
jgi:hypothetical protein